MKSEEFVLIPLLGLLTGIIGFFIDMIIYHVLRARREWTMHFNGGLWFTWTGFIYYVGHTVFFTIFAVAITAFVGPMAAGSGIPEMKAYLSGISINNLLSPRTLVAKVLGLTATLCAGLQVGKEGPYIHVSSCIAEWLMKFKIFRALYNDAELKLHMITTACATGVAATFGSPIGGVLFGIEVTSLFYQTNNYSKGFFSGIIAAFTFRFLLALIDGRTGALVQTNFPEDASYHSTELIIFTVFGAVMGFFSALLIYLNGFFAEIQKYYKNNWFFRSKWPHAVFIAVITGSISYPDVLLSKVLQHNLPTVLRSLYSESDLNEELWGRDPVLSLLIFVTVEFFLISVSILIPCPAGVFAPCLLLGGGFGRLFGELLRPYWRLQSGFVMGGYAMVGSAAFAASVTRTISSAVIVFELTGQLEHVLPLLLAVVAGVAVADQINLSVFDTLAQLKDLPYFRKVHEELSEDIEMLTAKDIMLTQYEVLTKNSTYLDIGHVLQASCEIQIYSIPVVVNGQGRLIGTVQVGDLLRVSQLWPSARNRVRIDDDVGCLEKFCCFCCGMFINTNDSTRSREMRLKNFPNSGSTQSLKHEWKVDIQSALEELQFVSVDEEDIDDPYGDLLLRLDAAPFIIKPDLPLTHISFYFRQLNLNEAWVVDNCQCPVGYISRPHLMKYLNY